MTEWHKFPDEIPQAGDYLITFDGTAINPNCLFIEKASFDKNSVEWFREGSGGKRYTIKNKYITAWAKLPKPYKPEEQSK